MEHKFTFKRVLSLLVVFTMLFTSFAVLAVPAAAESDIISVGKSYTASSSDYWGDTSWNQTSTAADTALTDGVKSVANYYESGCVGWKGLSGALELVVDLEGKYDMTSFSLYFWSGSMGVATPLEVNIFVSDDGEEWTFAPTVLEKTEVNTKSGWGDDVVLSTFDYTVDGDAVTGQYVKYILSPNGTFIFMDEIEVYGVAAEEAPVDPEADSVLTIAEAIALGASKEHNTYTEGKYYVTGVIDSVYNTTYGNMKIKDENGNILTVYGTYNADGSARYDALEVKPVAGDTVTVYGIIGQYSGTAQVKNGWITEHVAGNVEPEPPVEEPEADTELTIAEALALGKSKDHNTYTAGKYYVTGVITEVYQTTYGNMKITDEEGNILTVYGTYSADGSTRYDAMEVQPVAGDTVTVYGIIGQYNGTAQIKNGWITEHVVPVEPGVEVVVDETVQHVDASAGYGTNDVIIDGYTGLDEIKGYENNQPYFVAFMNNVAGNSTYSIVINYEAEQTFNTVTSYILDYANGCVVLPAAVSYEINGVSYEAAINANPNGMGTAVATLEETVATSQVIVNVTMTEQQYYFNMFSEVVLSEETTEPEVGTAENPAVIEIVNGWRGPAGEGIAELTGGAEYYWIITMPMDGNLNATFYVTDEEYNNYAVDYSYNGGELYNTYNYGNPALEDLKAGDTVILYCKVDETAPAVTVSANVMVDPVGSSTNPAPIVVGDHVSVIDETKNGGITYEWIAEADGTLTVAINTDKTANWLYCLSTSNGYYGDYHYCDDDPIVSSESIEVAAGDVVTITISYYDPSYETYTGDVAWALSFEEPQVEAPENVALGKPYTYPTDGLYFHWSDEWPCTDNVATALTDGETVAGYYGMGTTSGWGGASPNPLAIVIDLEGTYSISSFAYTLCGGIDGISMPAGVAIYVSDDGETFTQVNVAIVDGADDKVIDWTECVDRTSVATAEAAVEGRYVKFEFTKNGNFVFINELEVYGVAAAGTEPEPEPEKVIVDLVEGENEFTVPALGSAIANVNFENDLVLSISGNWYITVVVDGVEYWPNRMGVLEAPIAAGERVIEFKNSAEEDNVVYATVAAPIIGDTMDDPIVLESTGDYESVTNESYPEGVYYQYTATVDGTITVTINTESGWLYSIDNVTAGKYGDFHWSDDETLVYSETIEVSAGDDIRIHVVTYDPDAWTAPAGSVSFTLAEEAVVEVVEVYDLLVSHHNLYNWGIFESMIISGDGKTVVDVIGQTPYWWIMYVVENVDGKYVATEYYKNCNEINTTVVPAGGFLYYVYSNNSAWAAADEGKLLGYTFVFDGWDLSNNFAIDSTVDPAKTLKAYAPGVEIPVEPIEIIVNATLKEEASKDEDGNIAVFYAGEADRVVTSEEAWLRYQWFLVIDANGNVVKIGNNLVVNNPSFPVDRVTVPAGGALVAFFYNASSPANQALMDVYNAILAANGLDVIYNNYAEVTSNYYITINVNVEPEKPVVQPADKVELPAGANGLTNGGYIHAAGATVLLATDVETTLGELALKGDAAGLGGEAGDFNYWSVIIIDEKGTVIYSNTTLGRPDGVKIDVVVPAGAVVIAKHAGGALAEVGQIVTIYNVDLAALATLEGNVVLEQAGYTVEDAPISGEEYLLADVNKDGMIDQFDYILIKRSTMGTYELDASQLIIADINGDGEVDQYDYILIKRHCMLTYEITGTVIA